MLQVHDMQAPWGASIQAAWLIGASRHPDDRGDHSSHGDHGGDRGGDHASDGSAVDPVCGMTVTVTTAIEHDLHLVHDGTDFYFCGRGCKLEFGDDPGRFLDASYVPSM
jgi:YHS domain-containing protein